MTGHFGNIRTKWSRENLADVSCFPNSRKETLDNIVKVNVFGKYVFVFQNGNLEFNTWK